MRIPEFGSENQKNLISRRMREARFAHTLTQDELAGRLAKRNISLDRVAITKIETGNRCVFDFELPALADALKVDVRWLLGIQETGGPAS